jgi:hypothetical protein
MNAAFVQMEIKLKIDNFVCEREYLRFFFSFLLLWLDTK